MTKPRDLANSVNPLSVPASRLENQGITNSKISNSAEISSTKSSFIQSATGAVTRTAQSKLADSVNVKDFGAVGDGVTDDTAAFQAAVDYVHGQGGGTVFFQDRHLIGSTLVLKDYVTLHGPLGLPDELLPGNTADYDSQKGVLIIPVGSTISTRDGCSVGHCLVIRQGLDLPFPNASAATAGVAAFGGTAFTVGGAGSYFHHLLILGFNTAIYSSNYERIRCEYVQGDCNNGIDLRSVYDIAYVENCHFWPWTTTHQSWTTFSLLHRPGKAYYFSSVGDWSKLTNCFSYGYLNGFVIESCDNCNLIGCGADYTPQSNPSLSVGFSILGSSKETRLIGCQAAAQGTGVLVQGDGNFSTALIGCNFWENDTYHVNVQVGRAIIESTMFRGGAASGALNVNSASSGVTVIGNDFSTVPNPPIVCTGPALTKSIVWGNKFYNTSDTTVGQFLSLDNQLPNYTFTTYNTNAQLNQTFRTSRGNTTTPAAVANGDYALFSRGQVFNGSTFSDIAGLKFEVTGTPSASSTPGSIVLSTTPSGSTSLSPRVTVKPNGQVRFEPLASAPASPQAGDVYYDSSLNKLRCWNGSIWNDLF